MKTEQNKNVKTEDLKGLHFWDNLVHKKKVITFEEYCKLSCDLSSSQLYTFAKKAFSSLALCGFLMYLIVYLVQTLIYSSVTMVITSQEILQGLAIDISTITFAIIALPVLYALTSFIPQVKPKQRNLSIWQLILFAVASFGLVYVGNILGIGAAKLVDLFTGTTSVSPIELTVQGLNPYKTVLYIVIIPAVFEELIFRKLLIDKSAFFGETASALFSALFFALYHMNFYQFFYAFLVGYLFAIIYIKSGSITCTITLHGFINFVGTALPAMLGNNEKFVAVYDIVFLALGIVGIITIFLGLSYAKSKNGRYTVFNFVNESDYTPPTLVGMDAIKSVVLNPGMIIFIIFAIMNFCNLF